MNAVVLIPAYNPNQSLVGVVQDLVGSGMDEIVVVDDGSSEDCQPVFDQVAAFPQVTLLRHAVNLGKGAALKFGFNHIYNLKKNQDDFVGVITADADGQHLAADIAKVAWELAARPGSLVLGVRAFKGEVPLRSRLGNSITEAVFRTLVGVHITDTQTGLRGVPLSLVPLFMRITADRYEFELDMLIQCAEHKHAIVQVPIQTVYLEDNASSHFNPLVDSAKIYMVFLRFVASSLLTAVVDNIIFIIAFMLGGSVLLSQALARAASILVNFTLNKKFVFKHEEPHWPAFTKFVLLVVVMGAISYSMIQLMVAYLGFSVVPAKITAEMLLYLINFATQRQLIFRRRETA
jgi:putative flippase GtrA